MRRFLKLTVAAAWVVLGLAAAPSHAASPSPSQAAGPASHAAAPPSQAAGPASHAAAPPSQAAAPPSPAAASPPPHAAASAPSRAAPPKPPPNPGLGRWTYAYAAFGKPKYPPGFAHFDYVNPDAPRGGTIHLSNPDRRTSFDKYNPFTVKGNSPAAVMIFMFESLAVMAGDELSTMYGLLAQEMLVAPDKSSITFRLDPRARFANGDPVTAADVNHTFTQLTSRHATPAYRTRLAGVEKVTVVDARTIRFDLKEKSNDMLFTLGTLPLFSHKWGVGADGKAKELDAIVWDAPITSGPYTIAVSESGRRLELVRNPDYWARDLPVRRGQFNFDRVVYRFYQDQAVAMEAFKAGEFDIIEEYSARRWARQHTGPKWRDGRIVKHEFNNGFGAGLQSYQFNLRRPLFQDRRVREALNYTYDFNAVNAYRQYKRTESLFANSEFAAQGEPTAGELALLEPFRGQLPPEVFGPAWKAPRNDGPEDMRRNLVKARALLKEAGWTLAADGVLRNAKGEPFEFEILDDIGGITGVFFAWQRNLAKLGIRLGPREVDFALLTKRLENFDFDVTEIRITDFTLPSGGDLRDEWGSKGADQPGSNNYRGVKSPAIDALLERMQDAQTLDDLRDAARALDRVVTWEHYQVPDLYAPTYRVSHWDKFGFPATEPRFYTIQSGLDVWPAWAVTSWWLKDLGKR